MNFFKGLLILIMLGFIIYLGWYVMDQGGIDYSLASKEEKLFKTYIKDTIPEGVANIKADLHEELGYTLYISFTSPDVFIESLKEKYSYGKVDCSIVENRFEEEDQGIEGGEFYISGIDKKDCFSSYDYKTEQFDTVNSYMVVDNTKVYIKESAF